MKTKILIFLALLIIGTESYGQVWFDIGLKGGPGTSFLLNKEIFDDAEFNHKFTFSYFFGGKVGINFGEQNAVTINVTSTSIAQKLENTHTDYSFNERSLKATSVDFALFYRRTKGASYFEIGPQFSLLTNPQATDDGVDNATVNAAWAKNFIGATIGFGGFIVGGDKFSILAGLQATYGFTDLFPDDYQPGLDIASQYSDASTMPLAVMLNIEFNYSLGYLVRSSCGKRTSLISF